MMNHKAIIPAILLSVSFAMPAHAQQCTKEYTDDLQRQVDSLRLSSTELSQRVKFKQNELVTLENARKTQQSNLDKAKRNLLGVQAGLNASEVEYKNKLSIKLAYEAQTKETFDKFNSLNRQLETTTADKIAAENNAKQVEKAFTWTRGSLMQLSVDFAAATKEDNRLANLLKATQEAFDKARFTSSKAIVSAIYKDLVELYRKKSASEEKLRNLQLEHAQVSTTLERLNKELPASRQKVTELAATETSLKSQIANLLPKWLEISSQRSKNDAALGPAARFYQAYQDEVEFQTKSVAVLESSISSTLKRVADINAEIRSFSQSLTNWAGMIRSLTDMINRCRIFGSL